MTFALPVEKERGKEEKRRNVAKRALIEQFRESGKSRAVFEDPSALTRREEKEKRKGKEGRHRSRQASFLENLALVSVACYSKKRGKRGEGSFTLFLATLPCDILMSRPSLTVSAYPWLGGKKREGGRKEGREGRGEGRLSLQGSQPHGPRMNIGTIAIFSAVAGQRGDKEGKRGRGRKGGRRHGLVRSIVFLKRQLFVC